LLVNLPVNDTALSPIKIVLAILTLLALVAGAVLLFHYLGEHHHR